MNSACLIMRTSIKQQLCDKGQLIGKIFSYCIIVYLFYQVFATKNLSSERLWYLATTQWILFSMHIPTFQIAQDLDEGQFDYFLLRPSHYLCMRFYEYFGATLIRYVLLGVFYVTLSFFLTRHFPGFLRLILGSVIGLFSLTLYLMVSTTIGLLSFWIKDIKELYYLNLTACFAFGGLIEPLDAYATQFQFLTPYPWILWGPARYIMNGHLGYVFIGLLFWITFFYFLAFFMYEKGVQKYLRQGE